MMLTKKEHEEAQQNEAKDDSDSETDDLDTENMENSDDTDTDLDDLWTDDTDIDLGDTDTEIMDEVGSEYDNDIGTEYEFDIAVNIETMSTTVNGVEISTTSTTSSSTSTASSLQPLHGEDCCSAISGISYDDIHCLNISKSSDSILNLEEKWKSEQCGRLDKLPTDLSEGIANSANNESDCDHLWAYFSQNIMYRTQPIIRFPSRIIASRRFNHNFTSINDHITRSVFHKRELSIHKIHCSIQIHTVYKYREYSEVSDY